MPKREEPQTTDEPDIDVEDVSEEDASDDESEDEYMDMGNMLAQVLATQDGDTVCSALVKIANAMETQNKILVKILSAVSTKKA